MKPFDLLPNEWWKAPTWPGSQIADVYDILPAGNGTQATIVDAWSGTAFDCKRGDIIISNGGHTDYAGNEGYAFSVNPYSRFFLKWRRKWGLSARSSGTVVESYASDNSPSAAHTYNGLVYCPVTDEIFRMPGVFVWGTNGANTLRTYKLSALIESPTNNTQGPYWRQMANILDSDSGNLPAFNWDSVSGKFWGFRNGSGTTISIVEYNPVTNTWITDSTFDNGINTNLTSTLQPGNYWVGCGGGSTFYYNLGLASAQTETNHTLATTGATAIESATAPGFVYDGVNFVGWGGTLAGGTDNRDLYYLNFGAAAWTLVPGIGEIPTNPNANGTYSRFAYLGWGLCAVFNSTTDNVYFVRTRTANQNEDSSPYYMPFLRGNTSRFFNPNYNGVVPGASMS